MTTIAIKTLTFLFCVMAVTSAFSSHEALTTIRGNAPSLTQLRAWSLPAANKAPFGTWYQECDPTSRRTYYDDAPFEYNYVPLHEDWLVLESMLFDDETTASSSSGGGKNTEDVLLPRRFPRLRSNPLRAAMRLARRIRKNSGNAKASNNNKNNKSIEN